ncbi:uncharacterized protein LAESUDRAFT_789196 [Laetiporus sulphureus 93-53]|uniref:Dickkopf N-terminal cysteine-rich domain-containing protein n=1 Tax=Laetiporus sulphureus 93-53 TaxID=1314785 RepID=A0A165GXK2_9APHY|nr:uncharacterized protein LAESUDRAFT_789196 [Laetiporus sulphureus 93-53]KZT10965.1 hypothetical protein LAESUDRAFT_789196 [Laetiporus sulphureus 93-53]
MLLQLFALLLIRHAPFSVKAGSVNRGGNCSVSNQHLEPGTHQFYTECDSMTYCTSSSTCEWRGCRRDEYPFGYHSTRELPPMCGPGTFCPDEEDQCLPLLSVGSPCQLNRDDQCEGPPDHETLADQNGLGRNVNGSVCLNNICMWANVTVGQPCEIQNIVYVAFGPDGHDYPDIVSRYALRSWDNCRIGAYCDSAQRMCVQTKDIGAPCNADKECSMYNCLSSGTCAASADTPHHVALWVYVVVGIGAFAGTVGTLAGMFFVHTKERQAERSRRLQYWQEQNALRQSVLDMQKSARDSVLSLSGSANVLGTSTEPAVQDEPRTSAAQGMSRSSGLQFNALNGGLEHRDRGASGT